MSQHDPMLANSSAKDLVRSVDTDQNATAREIRMAEYLQRALDGEDITRLVLGWG